MRCAAVLEREAKGDLNLNTQADPTPQLVFKTANNVLNIALKNNNDMF